MIRASLVILLLALVAACNGGVDAEIAPTIGGVNGEFVLLSHDGQLEAVDEVGCDIKSRQPQIYLNTNPLGCPLAETDLHRSHFSVLRALDESSYGGFWISRAGLVTVAYVGEAPPIDQLYKIDRMVERRLTYAEVYARLRHLNNSYEQDPTKMWNYDWETAEFVQENQPQIPQSDG